MSRKRDATDATAPAAPTAATSGPLGPWRLTLAVVAAAVLTGRPLVDAATIGVDVDVALGRSFAVAFVVWVITGGINRILSQVEVDRARDEAEAARAERAAADGSGTVVHLPTSGPGDIQGHAA